MRNLYNRLPQLCQVNFDIAEVPEEGRQWGVLNHQMADLVDILQAVDWHIIAANSKNPPKPYKPYKRPSMKKKEKISPKMWPGKTIIDKKE